MRIFVILLATLLLVSCGKRKADVDGKWVWEHTNGHGETHQATVQLNEMDDTKVIGFYCAAFGDGSYVDCAGGDSPQKNKPNFNLVRTSPIEFVGKIRSNRSGADEVEGEIKLTYFAATDELSFDILVEPSGEFYFPDEVQFKRE